MVNSFQQVSQQVIIYPSSLEHIFTVRFEKEGCLSFDDLLKVGERLPFPQVQYQSGRRCVCDSLYIRNYGCTKRCHAHPPKFDLLRLSISNEKLNVYFRGCFSNRRACLSCVWNGAWNYVSHRLLGPKLFLWIITRRFMR